MRIEGAVAGSVSAVLTFAACVIFFHAVRLWLSWRRDRPGEPLVVLVAFCAISLILVVGSLVGLWRLP